MRGNHPTNTAHVYWQQRNKLVPSAISGDSPATHPSPQRHDLLPDWSEAWYRFRAPKMLPPSADAPPTRQPSQVVPIAPPLDDSWYRRLAPKSLPPSADAPATRQPSQRHDPLPSFDAVWWRPRSAKLHPTLSGTTDPATRRPSQRHDLPPVADPSHWQVFRTVGQELFWFKERVPYPEFPPDVWDGGPWHEPRRNYPPTPHVAYRAPQWPWPEEATPLVAWVPGRTFAHGFWLPWRPATPQAPTPDFDSLWWDSRHHRIASEITASAVPTRQPSQRFDPLPDFSALWWQIAARLRSRHVVWYVALQPDNRPMGRGRAAGTQDVTGG